MDRHMAAALDNYITGHGGEDQFADEETAMEEAEVVVSCPRCGGDVRATIDLVGDRSVGMDPGSVELDLSDHENCGLIVLEIMALEQLAVDIYAEGESDDRA